jgi:hypothetical protein
MTLASSFLFYLFLTLLAPLPPTFINSFLSEQARSLAEKCKEVVKVSTNDKLISLTATQLVVTLIHVIHVCEAYFTKYLTYHNQKIYRDGFGRRHSVTPFETWTSS